MTENSNKVHHGENIKFAMKYLEDEPITQEELAERMGEGYHQSTICRMVKESDLPDEDLEKVAKALKINVVFLREFPLKTVLKNIIKNTKGVEINHSDIVTVTGNVEQDNTDQENTRNYMDRITELSQKVGELTVELKYLKKRLPK